MKRLLLLLFAIFPLLTMAHDFEKDGIYYKITSSTELTVSITSDSHNTNKYSGDITIPESVFYDDKQYKVTSIEGYAFSSCSDLISVSIPNSVTNIGVSAFYRCSGLTSVNIPNSVTSIGDQAFQNCSGLISVIIGDKVTDIGSSAFYNCTGLTSVNIPNSVTSIGSYAFYRCSSLTSVSIPNSVTSIGDQAFCGCSGMTSVSIPNSVTIIGDQAFQGCSGKLYMNCNIPSASSYSDGAFYGSKFAEVEIGNDVTSIGDNAFRNCSDLTSVTIGNSVTSIGRNAFYECTSLASISVPNSVTTIGAYAFYKCTGSLYINCDIPSSDRNGNDNPFNNSRFNEVEIGNDVTFIGNYAFDGCYNLSSLKIGDRVNHVGDNAFSSCTSLTTTTIGKSVTKIGKSAFAYCTGKLIVNCNIPSRAFYDSNFSEAVIGEGVTSIGSSAFYECTNLSSVSIANSVTSIGESAFESCSGLKAVTISNSLSTIEMSVFKGCSELKTVTIPNSVTKICSSAFADCIRLTSVTIPNSVVSIGVYAFYNCTGKLFVSCNIPSEAFSKSNFSEVAIVDGVTNIGYSAFNECAFLISVSIPNSVTNIGGSAFRKCSLLKSIVIPDKVTSIGSQTFEGCSEMKYVTLGNGIQRIGESAFQGCIRLEYVTIPNSVTDIENWAFFGCSPKSLIIGSRVTSIGTQAFSEPTKTIWMTNTPPNGYSNAKGTINYVSNNNFTALKDAKVYQYLSSIFEVDGIKYVPVSPSERTCAAIDCVYDSIETVINISHSVSHKNVFLDVIDINPYTFYCNTNIKKATILAHCQIGDKAFKGCTNIEEISLGDVTSIGNSAFEGCLEMNSLAILGHNLEKIGNACFSACWKLKEFSIPDATKTIGTGCFSSCRSLTKIEIGQGLTSIPSEAFDRCSLLSEISIPKNISTIGDNAFFNCSLSKVIIEDRSSTLTLGSNRFSALFKNCPLDTVYIGGPIKYDTSSIYGYSPFYGNTTLRTVVVTDKEDEIYDYEFYGCTNLQNVTIGDGVKKIGDYAFSGCSSLKGFAFGTGLQSIGKEAFSDCTAMTQISSEAKVPPTCGTQALDDLNKWECTLYVPKSSIEAYKVADQWKDFLFIDVNTNVKAISPIIESGSEVTEQNAEDITEFKMNLDEGAVFAVNDDAKVELWIGGVLKGTAEKKDISLKDNVVIIKFTPVSSNAGARGMLGEFWNTVATSSTEDVDIQVKVAANSFKINGEDIADELSYSYTAKASVAEKIENDITSLDEIEAGNDNQTPVYNINGSRINSNSHKGIIIKNGNKVLIK